MKTHIESLGLDPQHVGVTAAVAAMVIVAYADLLITICCHLKKVTRRTMRIKTYLNLKSTEKDQEICDKDQRNTRLNNSKTQIPDRPNCTRNRRDLEEFKEKMKTLV